jgi:hypothetical protein
MKSAAFRKAAVASIAAIGLFAAGSLATSTDAHAGYNNFLTGFATGAFIGAVSTHGSVYGAPYGAYYGPACTLQKRKVWRAGYAYPVWETVQVCY